LILSMIDRKNEEEKANFQAYIDSQESEQNENKQLGSFGQLLADAMERKKKQK